MGRLLNKRALKVSKAASRTSLNSDLVLTFGAGERSIDRSLPLLDISYEAAPIARASFTHSNHHRSHRFFYVLDRKFSQESSLHPMIIHSVLSELNSKFSPNAIRATIQSPQSQIKPYFERANFVSKGNIYEYFRDAKTVCGLENLKATLHQSVNESNAIGRGYYIDPEPFETRSLELLLQEYNGFLWGGSDIAAHHKLALDEAKVIAKHARGNRGLEIGCGNGRVTHALTAQFDYLLATDYVAEIVLGNRIKFQDYSNLEFRQDDIRKSRLDSDSFDVVMFWENGIGSLLKHNDRLKAFQQMVRILRPGGKLILGVRSLPHSPIGHLMLTPQNPNIMGIYYTFSKEYLNALSPSNLQLVDFVAGDSRPAGGDAIFLVFQKTDI